MPIYEYLCSACGNAFEALVLNSKTRPPCPECNSKKLERQFSSFAAHGGSRGATPCADGVCPAPQMQGSCASGKCPLT